MASNSDFEFESLQDAQSIKVFLENLMEGIAKGTILLSTAQEQMELLPRSPMRFHVKARQKKDEGKISIKISWKDSQSFPDTSISVKAR